MRPDLKIAPVTLALAGILAGLVAGCSREASIARHLERADAEFAADHYDRAEIEYLNVVHLDPRSARAIGRLGEIYFDQGRVGQFEPFLQKAAEIQPDNVDVRLKLGLFRASTGRPDAARDDARFVLDHRPQDPEAPLLLADAATSPAEIAAARERIKKLPAPEGAPALVALGTLAVREHNFAEAETLFRRAQAADPKFPPAWSALGAIQLARKDAADAEKSFATAASLSPAHSPRRLQYAQFEIQDGKIEEGRRLLRELNEKVPDYLPAWLAQAELAARERKYDEAAAHLARVLARDPVHPQALLLDARIKLENGQAPAAVAVLEKTVRVYPKFPAGRYQLALAYSQTGDLAQAAASATQALALAPNYTDATVLLATISLRRGDARSAIFTLKQLVRQNPAALAQVWVVLAEAYRTVGDFDSAVAVYHEVEQTAPANPETSWLMGLIYLQQRRDADARQAFEKALQISADYLPALEQIVNLDLKARQFAEARGLVDAQLAKTPGLAGLHLLRARVLLADSDSAGAETELKKAIELQPDSLAAYLALARLYRSTNQQEKALANLSEVVAKNPRSVEALMLIGVIHGEQKNYAAARDDYEKLLAINPRFSPALNNLAYLYSEVFHDVEKGYQMAQRARDLLPGEPHTADTLGWILYQKHQYAWALTLLQESAAKLNDSADVHYHAGMANYMLGNEGPARTELRRALELAPDFAGHTDAVRHLAVLDADVAGGASVRALLEKTLAESAADPVALTRLAALDERAGDLAKAAAGYEAALKASPSFLSALTGLARIDEARGENDKAFELAKTAREVAPNDPAVAYLQGHLALVTGNRVWAVSLLQAAQQQRPDDPELLFDLAIALQAIGKVDDAAATMRLALEKNGGFPRAAAARQFLALLDLAANPGHGPLSAEQAELAAKSGPLEIPALAAQAAAAEGGRDPSAAMKANEKLLERDPDFAPATRRLAILYSAAARNDARAVELAVKARERFPDDPDLGKALGVALFRQSNFARAVPVLQDAAGQKRDDGELLYYLGAAQARLGDRSAAAKSLQRALELNLPADLAADARRILGGGK